MRKTPRKSFGDHVETVLAAVFVYGITTLCGFLLVLAFLGVLSKPAHADEQIHLTQPKRTSMLHAIYTMHGLGQWEHIQIHIDCERGFMDVLNVTKRGDVIEAVRVHETVETTDSGQRLIKQVCSANI